MDSLIALGQAAPAIVLPDLDGVVHRSQDQRGRVTVVNFWSAECPWSERTDPIVLQATQEADADPCGHHAKADCDCAHGVAPETAKGTDGAPSDFVRNIWTSP